MWLNGRRRHDREDVGVYDSEDARFPTPMRRFANIARNGTGAPWYMHSQHGVMGDGEVRVACYKQDWPTIYHWPEGAGGPRAYGYDELSRTFGWDDFDDLDGTRYAPDGYGYEFDMLGWHFEFSGDLNGSPPKYEASMSRPLEHWTCAYDYWYGAGFDD